MNGLSSTISLTLDLQKVNQKPKKPPYFGGIMKRTKEGDNMNDINAFRDLRQRSGMTQEKYAKYFKIPKRTIEDWDRGISKCAPYLIALMEYKLKHEGKLKDNINKGEHHE